MRKNPLRYVFSYLTSQWYWFLHGRFFMRFYFLIEVRYKIARLRGCLSFPNVRCDNGTTYNAHSYISPFFAERFDAMERHPLGQFIAANIPEQLSNRFVQRKS